MTTAIIGGVERHMSAWKPSPLKLRGVKPAFDVTSLPVSTRINAFPTDYDQGQLGSCGPNSLAETYEFDLNGGKYSRLFAYFFTRATEGDFIDDTGVTIPDLLSCGHSMGLPLETAWAYDIGKFQVPPPVEVLASAVAHRVEQWDWIVDLEHLLFELANGQPVMCGFQVPTSMQTEECARTGLVNVPSASDPAIGGHCVNFIGYDREAELLRATCHYGTDFGDHGTILLPFAHVTSGNVNDMAAIRGIS